MVSIVLPCYNPPENWSKVVGESYQQICDHINDRVEFILVNDGSTKHVSEESIGQLKELIPLFHYISYQQNMGKGFALRAGVKEAKGNLIIYTDTDFPYTIDSLFSVYDALCNGSDVVLGVKDKSYYKEVPFFRMFISKVLRKLVKVFLSIPVTDTQCGLKGFRSSQKDIFLSTTINRYLFDLEFVYKCYRQNPKLDIRPTTLRLKPEVSFRKMNSGILISELRNFLSIILNKSNGS